MGEAAKPPILKGLLKPLFKVLVQTWETKSLVPSMGMGNLLPFPHP
ncbi:uncharacterized protein G2W53_039231 [Senna tora]|uniref:Uncharacterized protein n=1 Tax=Senna tora TaxID=362788 RepID=A0A834SM62_9FABA|nr:uncharacterized protein G2W53_039231 [Senna tora]